MLCICAANEVSEIMDESEGRKPQRAASRSATIKKTRRKTLRRTAKGSKGKREEREGEEVE